MTWFKRAIVNIQPDTRPSTTYQLPLQCLGGLLAWGRLGEVVRDEEEELCHENQGAQCNRVRLKAPVTVLARRDTHPGGRKCCYCGGPSLTSVFISSWRLHPLHRPPVRPDPGLFTRSPPRRAELSSSAGAGIRKDEKGDGAKIHSILSSTLRLQHHHCHQCTVHMTPQSVERA